MPILLRPLARYFQFRGRASRSEFWWFYLFYVVVTVGGSFAGGWMAGVLMGPWAWLSLAPGSLGLVLLAPMVSVTVRRLHDFDRSGWWMLMNLVPVAGIVLLIQYCREGTRGENRFGPPDPA